MSNKSLGQVLFRYAAVNSLILDTYGQKCLDFDYTKMIDTLKQTAWNSSSEELGWCFVFLFSSEPSASAEVCPELLISTMFQTTKLRSLGVWFGDSRHRPRWKICWIADKLKIPTALKNPSIPETMEALLESWKFPGFFLRILEKTSVHFETLKIDSDLEKLWQSSKLFSHQAHGYGGLTASKCLKKVFRLNGIGTPHFLCEKGCFCGFGGGWKGREDLDCVAFFFMLQGDNGSTRPALSSDTTRAPTWRTSRSVTSFHSGWCRADNQAPSHFYQ